MPTATERHREAVRRWKRKNRARHLEQQRRWGKAWRERHPEKVKANNALNHAIEAGKIERGVCEVCGGWAEGHHDDYSKPLEVRWLCPAHHREAHRQLVPIGGESRWQ